MTKKNDVAYIFFDSEKKEDTLLNNYGLQKKKTMNSHVYNYCMMHILIILHGCIIVFLLEFIIIQEGVLFKKWSIQRQLTI